MPDQNKSVVAIDLGASTLRMRVCRVSPGCPVHTLGDATLSLDSPHTSVRDIAPDELLIGPKRLLEMSGAEFDSDSTPLFCPNPRCALARREWPRTASICALCGMRLAPRTALVAEELVLQAITRAKFDIDRAASRTVRPDIVVASVPIDWQADSRYRYLDFLKTSFAGIDVRLVDDPMAILRDASENPHLWKIPGIVSGDRVVVVDSGARRTQFYTAVASPRIGYFDAACSVESWGGLDSDRIIAETIADRLAIHYDSDVQVAWSRPIRQWKEALSASLSAERSTVPALHLPIGGASAETIDMTPPEKEIARILADVEMRIGETIEAGITGLKISGAKIETVLLAGGGACWPFFESAVRSRFPDAVIASAPAGNDSVVRGLACTLLADTLAWKLAPGRIVETVEPEPDPPAAVPTISELFAAAPAPVEQTVEPPL